MLLKEVTQLEVEGICTYFTYTCNMYVHFMHTYSCMHAWSISCVAYLYVALFHVSIQNACTLKVVLHFGQYPSIFNRKFMF